MGRGRVSRNDPCPCGSGRKFKNCCYGKGIDQPGGDEGLGRPPVRTTSGKPERRGKYPIGTVALYGPDDKTTTKIAAGVVTSPTAEPILKRWVATDVITNSKVQRDIQEFFTRHGVKSVVVSEGNMGCPHEEGEDFPTGEDCPFCPFWAGKQGSNRRD
jgi:SEC-C motif